MQMRTSATMLAIRVGRGSPTILLAIAPTPIARVLAAISPRRTSPAISAFCGSAFLTSDSDGRNVWKLEMVWLNTIDAGPNILGFGNFCPFANCLRCGPRTVQLNKTYQRENKSGHKQCDASPILFLG